MTTDDWWLMLGVFLLGASALIGFFVTKTKGFGRFSSSVLLIIIVLILTSLLYVGGKLEGGVVVNVLFAVLGFAGGLFTGRDGNS